MESGCCDIVWTKKTKIEHKSWRDKQNRQGRRNNSRSRKSIVTGRNRENIVKEFEKERGKMGHGMRGPKHIKTSERIVKRVIRGMLPEHRWGRGREAYARIKCYVGVPKEFEGAKKIVSGKAKKIKFS